MRVRQLQTHLQDQMLIYSTKIESLRGMKIALDATCWLRSIQMLKDPYADALGGCPPGLFGVISKELENFAKLNIHPIFVFDGMVPPLQHQMFQQTPGQSHLENAWTQLANNKDAEAQKSFAVATSRINSDICHFVFHFLKSKGFDCIRAPYIAGPQLAHLANENTVQAVLGQPGLLLYGLKKTILTMDFNRGIVEWVELDYILNQWGINKSQFIDICLLAGTEYCLTFPFLNLDYFQQERTSFSFQSAVDFIRQMPLQNWMSSFPDEKMRNDHVDGYCVCKSLLSHCPVLNVKDLKVEPLTIQGCPKDMSVLVGEKLPQFIYSLISLGHISYRLPSVLATGEWNDRQPPLIDSLEYRSLVLELEEYRSKTLGLVASSLGPAASLHFKTKKISSKTYFEISPEESSGRDLPIIVPNMLKWKFSRDELMKELKRQGPSSKIDLGFCLRWHAHEVEINGPLIRNLSAANASGTTTSLSFPSDLDSLTALVCLMILETLDYISEDGQMTVLGDAMKDSPIAFEESILLALEMMKFGLLTGEPLEAPEDKKFPQAVNYPTAQSVNNKTRSNLFISRVMSLVPMKLRNDLWAAKVDFDLAAFHCLVRVMNRSLRLTTEACLTNVLAKDIAKGTKLLPSYTQSPTGPVPSEILSSPTSPRSRNAASTSVLPAFMLPRACLGIVSKFFLDYVVSGSSAGAAKQFEADLKKKFPCTQDPIADLKAGFAFWDELYRIMDVISEPLGTTEMLDEMKTANRIITEKRKVIGI